MRCKAHVRRGGVAGRRSSGRGQCGHNGSAAPRWGAHALTVRVGRAASWLAVGGERKTKTREKKKNTTLRWHLHSHPQPCARGGPTAVHTGREKVAWPAARASLACDECPRRRGADPPVPLALLDLGAPDHRPRTGAAGGQRRCPRTATDRVADGGRERTENLDM